MNVGLLLPFQLPNRQTKHDSIIGYVTTGNFSLSLGEAYAIGAVPVARLFELREQATRYDLTYYPRNSSPDNTVSGLENIRIFS